MTHGVVEELNAQGPAVVKLVVRAADVDMPPQINQEQAPGQNPSSRKGGFLALSLITVSLILMAGGYIAYRIFGIPWTQNGESAQEILSNANIAHKAGNFDEAIPRYEALLNGGRSAGEGAYLKLRLAYDLFTRNQGDDRVRAVDVYKSIIEDSSVEPRWRALALGEMAFRLDLTGDHHFFLTRVLDEEPYTSFLLEEGGNVHQAVRRIYELSDSIYPNTLAKYQTAFMMAGLVTNGTALPGMTLEEMAMHMQTLVEEGDTLRDDIAYEPSYEAHLEFCRTMALIASNRVLQNIPFNELEEGFKKSIAIADEAGDAASQGTSAMVHILYAVFLNANASQFSSSREAEVINHLSVASQLNAPQYSYVREYAGSVWGRPTSDFIRRNFLVLADLSPEFSIFLRSVGWDIPA